MQLRVRDSRRDVSEGVDGLTKLTERNRVSCIF